MNTKIRKLLNNEGTNYIFPFFWQHGENEAVLRKYMGKIDEANIKAVCVESRPHPDFCGSGWWRDMDIILDEAKKRNMKVWILDDSHFPTGYANGAMKDQPHELYRQSIWCRYYDGRENEQIHVGHQDLNNSRPHPINDMEKNMGLVSEKIFDDDKRIGIYAIRIDCQSKIIDLETEITENGLDWKVPEGNWRIYILYLSRNQGYHRNYINMMSLPSCRVQLDAVYEPHYERYKEEFGKTIAGFFSDEPELGNGQLYGNENYLGHDIDFPWSDELEKMLKEEIGPDYIKNMIYLWENQVSPEKIAAARYHYMDAVTRLVKQDFSEQIGDWCRNHGVEYIGHLIEDNNLHARLGSSLGHYFRGLSGQDMAGIDDIGGQVIPQGEDTDIDQPYFSRTGEFFHYMLGSLGSSAAAIEPRKKGRAMCEIFGAYGWSEGVSLEKYLIDHFTVRGINHFVPHAFSAKEYPDPDCPPHFYAHGNNPQYRHFGALMKYTNNICELINDGHHIAPAAILYHAEAEWTGKCMFSHKAAHLLLDSQINYDYLPQDVFKDRDSYRTQISEKKFTVNTQNYQLLIIPTMQFVSTLLAGAIEELLENGIKVCFIDQYPEGIFDAGQDYGEWMEKLKKAEIVKLTDIVGYVKQLQINEIEISPANDRLRYYHYEYSDECGIYYFINEGTETYHGTVHVKDRRESYLYDAWDNTLYPSKYDGNVLELHLEPRKSIVLVLDTTVDDIKELSYGAIMPNPEDLEKINFGGKWKRSICRSIEYPQFHDQKAVFIPDCLEDEEKLFSGFVRYENTFNAESGQHILLEIENAAEGVEVFLNGKSLGIQIVPTYRYLMVEGIRTGENQLVIEVATTLERETSQYPNMMGMIVEPTALSGIKGNISLFRIE